jgi:hypothetical protein
MLPHADRLAINTLGSDCRILVSSGELHWAVTLDAGPGSVGIRLSASLIVSR